MKALVYTGTQELVYRDEPNPIEVSGESILKYMLQGYVVRICMLIMDMMKEECPH